MKLIIESFISGANSDPHRDLVRYGKDRAMEKLNIRDEKRMNVGAARVSLVDFDEKLALLIHQGLGSKLGVVTQGLLPHHDYYDYTPSFLMLSFIADLSAVHATVKIKNFAVAMRTVDSIEREGVLFMAELGVSEAVVKRDLGRGVGVGNQLISSTSREYYQFGRLSDPR